ncbi:Butirosin biosynthesis, BtrG-like protein [Russula dissimulans]|nr:Butirosin biosynthesis, BtrG-like protein [Russula dissimulans]
MPDSATRGSARSLYFGYGSNIWIDQMSRRCPENKFVGVALLQGWCWIINQCGYATIIPSSEDYVYGFVYELSPADEASLDKYERVPDSYVKRSMPVQLITPSGDGDGLAETVTVTNEIVDALVYIDILRTNRDAPKTEYIYRINKAMEDGLQKGIPQFYVDKYIRPFIPLE